MFQQKVFFFLSPKKDEEHALAKEKQDKEYKPFTNHTKEINTHINIWRIINCSIAPKHTRHPKGVNCSIALKHAGHLKKRKRKAGSQS